MPAARNSTGRSRARPILAIGLSIAIVLGLMLGLAACRGFFGQAPIALLVITAPIDDQEVPIAVTCDISGSNDPDGTIASYDLDFGDGSTHATGTDVSVNLTHPYMVAGTYTVKLTITDNDGRIGMDSDTVTIGPVMITFASNRSDYDIWRMQVDGTNLTKVLDTSHDELFPDLVRGTRGKIAYAAEDTGNTNWDIWTMTVTGTNNAQLTTTAPTQSPSNEIQPSWSYDGTKIAYASNWNATQTPSDSTWTIRWIPAAGGSQTSLITQSASWAPTYSPVNNDIVFVSSSGATGGSAIWLWDALTSSAAVIYDSSGHDGDVSTSGYPSGLTTALHLPFGVSKPAWKPDGTKIAFSTDKDGDIDIYVMDADGLNVQTLEVYVNSLITGSVTAGSVTSGDDEFCPYWLEDNSGLAFVKKVGTAYNIYKVSFSTGLVTPLTNSVAPDSNVSPASRK